MATYELKWYLNGWHKFSKQVNGIDKARSTACSIINYLIEQGARVVVVYVHNVNKATSDYGQVWTKYYGDSRYKNNDYLYLPDSKGSEKGIIWKINPKTGKTISLYGYEE